jgi:penicillin-binding protein 1A
MDMPPLPPVDPTLPPPAPEAPALASISPRGNAPYAAAAKRRSLLGRFARPLFYLFSLGITALVIGAVAVITLYHIYTKDLPDSGKLAKYQPAGMTRLYGEDGSLIAEYAKERRVFVPFREIPKKVVQAFVAAEDQNFYSHRGIDPMGIARAVFENLRNYSTGEHSLVGGSTITQQVVKNFLLTREKSYERKIKEAILALRITQTYSKEKILELYLNEIYLGMGTYGVVAASDEYFGKELSQLTTEEVALLAAMPKAPAYYDPRRRPEEALHRRNYVLARMEEDGYINQAEYARAAATPLTILTEHAQPFSKTPFFSEEVRRWLLAKYGEETLYRGNLFVKTTVDPSLQTYMDTAFRAALVAYDRRHGYRGALLHLDTLEGWKEALPLLAKETPIYGKQKLAVVMGVDNTHATIAFAPDDSEQAEYPQGTIPMSAMRWARAVLPSGALGVVPSKPSMVVKVGDVVLVNPLSEEKNEWSLEQIPLVSGAMVAMRPQTGEVLAMTGGYSFGKSQFNRATQANRQPGSAFKPFVYLAGMERGFTPSTIVLDAPIELPQGAGLPMWRPGNYDGKYLGAATLRMGLEKSHNAMTVRLSQMTGLKAVKSVAKRFGIYPEPANNFSVVLGSYETTVMRLTTAYAMLANGGLKVEPTLVKRIDDRDGKTIYRADMRECVGCNLQAKGGLIRTATPPILQDTRERVVDPRVAYQMEQLLEGVVKRGTATKALVLGYPVAGKTGTTNDSRDAWFVGFTPEIVVGTYIGFDTPRNMGKKETGGAVALPAFIQFMQQVYADGRTPPEVPKPEGVVQVAVDRWSGVPAMPWQGGGSLITETFVTGAPIFIPGEEMQTADPEETTDTDDRFVDYDYGNQGYRSQTYGPDGQIYDPATGGSTAPTAGGLPRSYRPSSSYVIDPRTGAPVPAYSPSAQGTTRQGWQAERRPVTQPQYPAVRPNPQATQSWQNLPPRHPTRLQEERRYRSLRESTGQGGASSGTGGLY